MFPKAIIHIKKQLLRFSFLVNIQAIKTRCEFKPEQRGEGIDSHVYKNIKTQKRNYPSKNQIISNVEKEEFDFLQVTLF